MIYNQWYVILSSNELKRNPIKVKRLNLNLVLWRDENRNACCISDKCCHRGASLSCGTTENGLIVCPFHGFQFDATGKVVRIPANGKNAPVPDSMTVNAYRLFEKYGLIWMWYGDPDRITGDPFFWHELGSFSYAGFKDPWSVHYSRAIENQLDVVHLPFVHRTTIGRGNKTLVNGPVVIRNDELITFYVKNEVDNGKTIPQKPEEIADYEKLFYLRFHFPNIWQNYISDKIRAFAAFVPVDEEHSIVYIRYYQRMFRLPLLKHLMNLIGIWASIIILRQDKRVVITQLPKKSTLKMEENLIPGDRPIVEYRKHRETLIGASK